MKKGYNPQKKDKTPTSYGLGYAAGHAAFHAGKKAIPVHDDGAMGLIKKGHDARQVLSGWHDAWHKENAKTAVKESKDDWQVGDNVHLGFGAKGGSGMFGTIHKVHDHEVEVKSRDKHYSGITKKHDHKIWKGPKKFLTRNESEENCRNKLNEWGGLVKLATTAVQAIARASGTAGGGTAIGTLVRRGSDTIRKTIDKYTNNKDKKYTTGGQFGADGKFTTGGTAPDYTQGSFKREATDMNEGYASGREAVKKMLDANKAKARQTILGSGMSKAAKAADVEQSDREYIRQKQTKTKTEGYAGGAQISHNHGNPAPDLTKDTKVSTSHRPGRSTSRPGTATPPSYGTKARDLTKNSNPHTRHKPLTAGRIRENIMDEGYPKLGTPERKARDKAALDRITARQGDETFRKKVALNKVGAGLGKSATPDEVAARHRQIFKKEDENMGKDLRAIVGMHDENMPKAKELRDIVESYYDSVPSVLGSGNKAAEKINDFMHHARQYHSHKYESEHNHKMAGDHEEEHGVTPFGEAHYHKHMYHEKMTSHHAEHLAKEHGMDRGKMANLCHKHRHNVEHFVTALAQEGKEPVTQPKPNRGRIFRK